MYTQLPGDPTHGQPLSLRLLHRLPPSRLQRSGFPASPAHSFAKLFRSVASGGGDGISGIVIVVQGLQSGHPFAIQTIDRVMDYG